MDDITARYKMGYPETPVNLPDNMQKAEYGSDAIADLISSLGFEHVFLVLFHVDVIRTICIPVPSREKWSGWPDSNRRH